MRIAVMGSWRHEDRDSFKLRDEDGFRRAADALGRRLLALGHSLVVGSDGHDTADYLAARGATMTAGPEMSRRIRILAPRKDGYDKQWFTDLRQQHPRLFSEQPMPMKGWASAKVFQVRYADAVLILAGAKATRQAGLTAAASGKRVACIGSFGGSARELNELFMESRDSWSFNLPDVETIGLLQNPWSDVLVDDVLAALRAVQKPRILIVHGRADDRSQLKTYLRDAVGLPEPIVLADLKMASELIAAKFERLASEVDAAIALCTPDDVGGLATGVDGDTSQEPRARQNVWLEIGWFWGRLSLRRVLILTRGAVDVPSDLAGVESYEYARSPVEREIEIGAFLARVGGGRA